MKAARNKSPLALCVALAAGCLLAAPAAAALPDRDLTAALDAIRKAHNPSYLRFDHAGIVADMEAFAKTNDLSYAQAMTVARRTAERAGFPAAETVHPFAPRFSYARYVPPDSSNAPAELVWEDSWRRPGPPAAVRVAFGAETWELPVPCFDPAAQEEGDE